jgi:hypothetical protein
MTDKQVALSYDEAQRTAVLTLPTGKTLKISNVTREQADAFLAKHAAEFARRDGCLETPAGTLTRGPQP